MEERLLFVPRRLEGEPMTDVCREFGISRKTGYKLFNRYREEGGSAFGDRSRRPVRYANQLPPQVESLIVGLKRDKPHWGARKLRELLDTGLPGLHYPLHDRQYLVTACGRICMHRKKINLSCAPCRCRGVVTHVSGLD